MLKLTTHEFKIWLVTNGLTQKALAEKLCMTSETIVKYNNNNRYPIVFQYALKAIEAELKALNGSK